MSTQNSGTALLDTITGQVEALRAEILDVSHRIHEQPEIRFTEHHAAKLLRDSLRAHGFDVRERVADLDTAFVAEFTNAGDHDDHLPTIAIFLEYDALEGLGHGCGHNTIAAAGLGAAIAAKRWLAEHPDTAARILAVGSPGEEGGGGKAYLIEAGVLSEVDAAMMVHPSGENRIHLPSLAREAVEFVFTGVPAHAAATPHEGRNALDAATLALNAIGLLRQQIRPESRIHAIITDGGQAPNIIPERTSIKAFVRSPDTRYLTDRLVPAVHDCARGAALATGTDVEIRRPAPAYAAMRSNAVLAELITRTLTAMGREPGAGLPNHAGGSTDMGNVSQVVPSAHPLLELVSGVTMHTHEAAEAAGAEVGDQVALDGAVLLATTTIQLLTTPGLLQQAKDAFAEE
ncbi:amidohydrolase [Saccharopolyspora shandongensis]|uniref:amidohydrolase n=1 Tax=Saccharopolyspora shandongensis TaxID=418495 RepID=UPI0033EC1E5F